MYVTSTVNDTDKHSVPEMEAGQDFWPVTVWPDGFWHGDPTRPDPVSSLNDDKCRNVVTSQGQSARK